MADYYPLLRKAVDALDRPGRDERFEVYERARRTVVNRLRGGDSPWSDADIEAQIIALDDAVRRIEREFEPVPAAASAAAASAAPLRPSRRSPRRLRPRRPMRAPRRGASPRRGCRNGSLEAPPRPCC